MRAVQMTATGGPDALEPADLPDPRPGPGELLVDVAAAGVNYTDTYHRRGVYPVDLPLVPGQEGAGRVTALGGGTRAGSPSATGSSGRTSPAATPNASSSRPRRLLRSRTRSLTTSPSVRTCRA